MSSRSSTPAPSQMTPFDLSSEEISRPVSPVSMRIPTQINEESREKFTLSESGSSDEEIIVDIEVDQKPFIPGGQGEVIDVS